MLHLVQVMNRVSLLGYDADFVSRLPDHRWCMTSTDVVTVGHSATDPTLNVRGFAFVTVEFCSTDEYEVDAAFLRSTDTLEAIVYALESMSFQELWLRTLLNVQPSGEIMHGEISGTGWTEGRGKSRTLR